jgi:hypothetical protein
MLAINHLVGFNSGDGSVKTLSYETHAQETSGSASPTFAAQDIGTAAGDRRVIVAFMAAVAGGTAARSLSSFTVGGISGTIVGQINSGGLGGATCAIGIALVPSGATADIVPTYSGTVARSAIGVWSCTGLLTSAAFDVDSNAGTDPAALTLDAVPGGFMVAAAIQNNNASFTWTNGTERFDQTVDGAGHSGADAVTGSSIAVTADYSVTDARCAMVAATF